MRRGEIWWADLPEPSGSMPAYRRPVLVVQSDLLNATAIRTVVVAVLTGNLGLAGARGNVLLTKDETGLPRDSVVNTTQLFAADRGFLTERVGALTGPCMDKVEAGLRLVLEL